MFYSTGSVRGIVPQHAGRLTVLLQLLDAAESPKELENLPGLYFHKLVGKQKASYAVRVNGNWRLTFSFDGNDVIKVDYLDYH
jgi:toxin HigB-1